MKIFLEENNLLDVITQETPEKYYIPLFDGNNFSESQKIAQDLRKQ
jgi:hypothetical protein